MPHRFIASRNLATGGFDSLWRQDTDTFLYERWDPWLGRWVADPAGVRETGIGGDADMEDVTVDQASAILVGKFDARPDAVFE